MKGLLRSLGTYRELRRAWVSLLILALIHGPITVVLPLIEKRFIDNVLLPQRLGGLAPLLLVYGALWLVIQVNSSAVSLLNVYVGERLGMRLRQRLFAHCQALGLTFSDREHSGQTMALFSNDVPYLSTFLNNTMARALTSIGALGAGTVLMLTLSWTFAVTMLVALPLLVLSVTVATRPLRRASRRVQDKAADITEYFHELLAGLREVITFDTGNAAGLRFGRVLNDALRLRMRLTVMEAAVQNGQSLFSLAVRLVMLGYGGYLVIQSQMTLGTLVAMQSLYLLMYTPAMEMMGLAGSAQKALASADRIGLFLAEQPRVIERAGAYHPTTIQGAVTFEGVHFAYHPDKPVLHDICFAVSPGERVAVVGPSGAGKTTLVSLIARFYDPTAGRVCVDGIDVRDMTFAGLRQHLAIVFQDTFLFATTIRANIGFGREHIDDTALIEAARGANAWEFIERLPDGLDTNVGERGVQLSEGQKQRLAIARAFLHDPRILILDEPTSALDARSEHLLQSALEQVMEGRTTFVIAHRLATVLNADRILVLEGGRIVEQGTHAQLMEAGGLYQELFNLQFATRSRYTAPLVTVPMRKPAEHSSIGGG